MYNFVHFQTAKIVHIHFNIYNIHLYNLLKNKLYTVEENVILNYISENSINITELILFDGMNDIFEHYIPKEFHEFSKEKNVNILILFLVTFVITAYVSLILSNLTLLSKIILMFFIIIRTSFSTISGIKKDKLVLINAIYHIEKILTQIK
jgi:hypothetical protein